MATEGPAFRFAPLAKIASGGTATVFVGAPASGPRGALVALKRPHAHVLDDPRQRAALLKEARLGASLHHPNIVELREVEVAGEDLQLVMDYVEGAALGTLIALEARRDARLPAPIALRIVLDACAGLEAVHAKTDEAGRALGLVHRDVSPQNILVGVDGVARLTDFGLAKAVYEGAPSTTEGSLKGKLGYMAPEYVNRGRLDRAVDVFALGVVLWEALAGQRLFRGDNEAQTLDRVLRAEAPALADVAPELAPFDAVVARAVAKDPAARYGSAALLAGALEEAACGHLATRAEVGAYVLRVAGAELTERRARIAEAERERRKPARRRAATALAAVSFLGAGAAVLFARAHAASPVPVATTQDAAPAVAEAPVPAPPAASTSAVPAAEVAASPSAVAPSSSTPPARPPRPRPAASANAPPGRVAPPNPYVHPTSPR